GDRLRLVPEAGQALLKVLAVDQLHAVVEQGSKLAGFEDRHDVGMVQRGDGLGLAVEPLDVARAGARAVLDHLQGDEPVEAGLPGVEDEAHGPRAQLFDQLEVPEAGARPRRRQTVEPGPRVLARPAGDAVLGERPDWVVRRDGPGQQRIIPSFARRSVWAL